MRRVVQLVALVSACASLMAPGGCTRDETPAPASQPVAAIQPRPAEPPAPKSEPSPLLPGYESWTREAALTKLADVNSRLSAAARLVELTGLQPLCVPNPLPAKTARRLRVVSLSESQWAIGLSVGDGRRLAAPVFIDADGDATLPIAGVEGEVTLLYLAEDPGLFPHMLVTPERVLLVGEELQTVIVAKSLPDCRFDVRDENGYWYLALMCRPLANEIGVPSEAVEVGRYEYDPFESAFMGPLIDKLPDPPGGKFELDLEQSVGLIPVGGELPEPPKIDPPVVPDKFGPTPF